MITKTLIPARGGSKTIPRKNIIEINGKPLIYYAIKASLDSDVDETWVSTDDDEIAYVSEKFGASVIKRPKEICDDITMPDSALIHFSETHDFDNLVFIQPTSPLLDSNYINDGIRMIDEYDSVFSAYKEHWYPRWTLDNEPDKWNPKERPRRQDCPTMYVENGAFYITTRKQLLSSKLRYGGKVGIVEMPYSKSFQLDVHDDMIILEKLLS